MPESSPSAEPLTAYNTHTKSEEADAYLFSAPILNWALDYSILGKAYPITEHQPPLQARCLRRDFF
jgi:hypothetical protein